MVSVQIWIFLINFPNGFFDNRAIMEKALVFLSVYCRIRLSLHNCILVKVMFRLLQERILNFVVFLWLFSCNYFRWCIST